MCVCVCVCVCVRMCVHIIATAGLEKICECEI